MGHDELIKDTIAVRTIHPLEDAWNNWCGCGLWTRLLQRLEHCPNLTPVNVCETWAWGELIQTRVPPLFAARVSSTAHTHTHWSSVAPWVIIDSSHFNVMENVAFFSTLSSAYFLSFLPQMKPVVSVYAQPLLSPIFCAIFLWFHINAVLMLEFLVLSVSADRSPVFVTASRCVGSVLNQIARVSVLSTQYLLYQLCTWCYY